jgi:hypothetical protein
MARNTAWKSRLVSRVGEADRLVVWDYGFDAGKKKHARTTHFEITSPDEIEEFLERIEIDEPASTGRCMCLGSPHFDFMKGKKVLASLGLHHGVRLRWESKWPADAELTRASSFEVCGWFRDHGIQTPWRELQQQVDRSLAWQRRAMALRKILPGDFGDKFLRLEEDEEILEFFRSSSESRTSLAVRCLKILGCDNCSWELIERLTHATVLSTLVLPLLGKRAGGNALQRAIVTERDRDACYGAARVLFFFGGWENFTQSALNATLPTLIPVALRHPRQRNRQYVMWVLSQMSGGDEPLRWVLEDESAPVSIRQEEATEPDGTMYTRGLAPNEPLNVSDRAYAAWLLGGMHVSAVRDSIEDLAAESEGADRRVFERALEALGH